MSGPNLHHAVYSITCRGISPIFLICRYIFIKHYTEKRNLSNQMKIIEHKTKETETSKQQKYNFFWKDGKNGNQIYIP